MHHIFSRASAQERVPLGVLPIRCIAAVVRHHAHMDSGRRFALQLRGLEGGVNGPAQAVELQAVGSAEERGLQCERWTRAITALVCAARAAEPRERGRSASLAPPPRPAGACFGAPLASSALVASEHGRMIPAVLQAVWGALCALPDADQGSGADDGLDEVGIFRLSADSSELSATKQWLDAQGRSDADADADAPNRMRVGLRGVSGTCLACLIKAYLRDLPDDLWRGARPELEEALANQAGPEALGPLLSLLGVRERDVLLWACDVAAAVVARGDANGMSVQAMAVVLAPNVVRPLCSDPLAMLAFTGRSVAWLTTVLAAHTPPPAAANAAADAAADAAATAAAFAPARLRLATAPKPGPFTLTESGGVSKMSASPSDDASDRSMSGRRSSSPSPPPLPMGAWRTPPPLPLPVQEAAKQVAAITVESSAPFGSVAGLEEGVLLAACGETDNEAQAARLSHMSELFSLRAAGSSHSASPGGRLTPSVSVSLHKRRLSEGSYQAMLARTIRELDEHSHTAS